MPLSVETMKQLRKGLFGMPSKKKKEEEDTRSSFSKFVDGFLGARERNRKMNEEMERRYKKKMGQ